MTQQKGDVIDVGRTNSKKSGSVPKPVFKSYQQSVGLLVANQLRHWRQQLTDEHFLAQETEHGRVSRELIERAREGFATAEEWTVLQAFEAQVNQELAEDSETDALSWSVVGGEPFPLLPRTQEEVGILLGVGRTTIERWEGNKQKIPLDKWIMLARRANLDPATALLPTSEMLQADEIVLKAEPGLPGVRASEWLGWVTGFAPLREQNLDAYLRATSTPPVSTTSVSERPSEIDVAVGRAFAREDVLSGDVLAKLVLSGQPISRHVHGGKRTYLKPQRQRVLHSLLAISSMLKYLYQAASGNSPFKVDQVKTALYALVDEFVDASSKSR